MAQKRSDTEADFSALVSKFERDLRALLAREAAESIEILDLVAVGDVAQRASLLSGRSYSVDAVSQWTRRHVDAPAPVAITSAGAIWRWADWEVWLRSTGRLQ